MRASAILSLLLLAAVPVLAQDRPAKGQLRLQQRITVRIPRLPVGRQPLDAPPVRWSERKGPKCVAMQELESAQVEARDAIDLTTADGERLRALLDKDCGPMDFYSGFYLKRTADNMVCADRDAIRVRSGASCPIEGFRRLVAKR